MNISIVISLALGVGWILASVMGIAIFALAYHIGSLYAFTVPGASRMGPRLGKNMPVITFICRGESFFIHQIISPEQASLLLFLHTPHMYPELISDLLKFTLFAKGKLKIVIFSLREVKRTNHLFDSDEVTVFSLDNQDLTTKLGIRVVPYALLLDQNGKLIAKGLVNHLAHLCFLVRSAILNFGENKLIGIDEHCNPLLRELETESPLNKKGNSRIEQSL